MLGDQINEGEPLGTIYCRDEAQAASISANLRNAYKITDEKPQKLELIKEIVS